MNILPAFAALLCALTGAADAAGSWQTPEDILSSGRISFAAALPELRDGAAITPQPEPEPLPEESKVLVSGGALNPKPLKGNALPDGLKESDLQWPASAQYLIKFDRAGMFNLKTSAEISLSFNYAGKYSGPGIYIGAIEAKALSAAAQLAALTLVAELPRASVHNCGAQGLEPVACIDLVLNLRITPLVIGETSLHTYRYELRADGQLQNPKGELLQPGATDAITAQ